MKTLLSSMLFEGAIVSVCLLLQIAFGPYALIHKSISVRSHALTETSNAFLNAPDSDVPCRAASGSALREQFFCHRLLFWIRIQIA